MHVRVRVRMRGGLHDSVAGITSLLREDGPPILLASRDRASPVITGLWAWTLGFSFEPAGGDECVRVWYPLKPPRGLDVPERENRCWNEGAVFS